MATSQETLTAVESAIYARLTGGAIDSYTVNGIRIERADLATLYKVRTQLAAEVARSTRGDRILLADVRGS